jgi:hypothetical protein
MAVSPGDNADRRGDERRCRSAHPPAELGYGMVGNRRTELGKNDHGHERGGGEIRAP